jgi:hypothetical protein
MASAARPSMVRALVLRALAVRPAPEPSAAPQ